MTNISHNPGACLSLTTHADQRRFEVALAYVGRSEWESLHLARESILHPSEMRSYTALPAARRQTSYLLGRYSAKKALSQLLVLPDYSQVEIAAGLFSQPVVQFPTTQAMEVSISHVDEFACALAFPSVLPMGVDLEWIDEQRTKIMKSQISADELAEFSRHGVAEPAACTVIWTAKEAVSKSLRCGLTCPFELLATCDIKLNDQRVTGRFLNFGQYQFQAWVGKRAVVTIVLPRKSELDADLSPVISKLDRS